MARQAKASVPHAARNSATALPTGRKIEIFAENILSVSRHQVPAKLANGWRRASLFTESWRRREIAQWGSSRSGEKCQVLRTGDGDGPISGSIRD